MSCTNSPTFPESSAASPLMPVTFPPGLERLSTSPVLTGSPATAITIGISRVASLAATARGVNHVTITSTLSRTSSAASAARRTCCPGPSETRTEWFALDLTEFSQCLLETAAKTSPNRGPRRPARRLSAIFGSCASIVAGHAVAALATKATKSRRLTRRRPFAPPRARLSAPTARGGNPSA
jgi:hypothetical protein